MRRSTLLAAVLAIATPASAAIRVGEVSATRSDAIPVLRKAVEDEVAMLRVKKSAILSVSLVKLETRAGAVTCVVSATLRSENGSLFAILEGRAQATGAADAERGAAALRTAVHGAISRIPDALR